MSQRRLSAHDCDPDVVRSCARIYIGSLTRNQRRAAFRRAGRGAADETFCIPTFDSSAGDGEIMLTGWQLRALTGDLDR